MAEPAGSAGQLAALGERHSAFLAGVYELTRTERLIYEAYVRGETTKEIMQALNITENTLKFRNKNIYAKLGVPSRKQLVATHKQLCTLTENGALKP